ncbi:MAG TPA: hypothetical protein VGL86_08290 [Polyangia bacterium]
MFTATDGTVFDFENRSGYFWPESTTAYYTAALRASAIHDLGCPLDELESFAVVDNAQASNLFSVGMPAASESTITGCGWRAAYRLIRAPQFLRVKVSERGRPAHYLDYNYRVVLVSRSHSTEAMF